MRSQYIYPPNRPYGAIFPFHSVQAACGASFCTSTRQYSSLSIARYPFTLEWNEAIYMKSFTRGLNPRPRKTTSIYSLSPILSLSTIAEVWTSSIVETYSPPKDNPYALLSRWIVNCCSITVSQMIPWLLFIYHYHFNQCNNTLLNFARILSYTWERDIVCVREWNNYACIRV